MRDLRFVLPQTNRPFRVGGKELKLWQRYLPTMRDLENVPFWPHDNVPHLVTAQLEKAPKTPRLFDR
jgi:hypothetical protein